MRRCVVSIALCLTVSSTAAWAVCTSAEEKQIAEVRNSWLSNWNSNQLDNVMKLYATHATYLPSDGSRVSGQKDIRAYFEKLIGSKDSVESVTTDCSGDMVYDSGSYAAVSADGKRVEGSYLVVLKHQDGKWLVVQHVSTTTP
jgi:uncharacterized protein (TIGR02246 family)